MNMNNNEYNLDAKIKKSAKGQFLFSMDFKEQKIFSYFRHKKVSKLEEASLPCTSFSGSH